MLGGLARWLRTAGYDTLFAEGEWPDRELVNLCARDDRILLTTLSSWRETSRVRA